MPKLLLLVGLPGSGKSSLVRSMQQTGSGLVVISTDAIRARLFGDEAIQGEWLWIWREVGRQFRQAVQWIQEGKAQIAIYDATNTKRSYRKDAIALAHSAGFTQIVTLWLDVPLEVCLRRNQQRDRQVPEDVIQQMHRQLTGAPPHPNEGIEGLIVYRSLAYPALDHRSPNWSDGWAIELTKKPDRFGNCPNLEHPTEPV
ncbi:AAA family ATPase [Egbenema bharatensis]|uniref:AAA family ATPase n=1 Tax=Egbenema bharatensis TaxID=3463334 RepID=UPI003A8ACA31